MPPHRQNLAAFAGQGIRNQFRAASQYGALLEPIAVQHPGHASFSPTAPATNRQASFHV